MKTLVIAGNRQQADQWIKDNLNKRAMSGVTTLSWSDYIVVSDVERIRGISDPTGVFIGTWIERKDLAGIFQQILLGCDITTNKHRTINELWGRWKEHHHQAHQMNKLTAVPGGWINESLAIQEAAERLAKEIDEEVLRRALAKP